TITPGFEWVGRGFAATLFHRTLVGATARVRVDLVRFAIHDVHATTISFPSRNAGCEVLVGISDTRVMLFFEFVFYRIGRGITPRPEGFNEVVAFFGVRELLECRLLFIGD